MKRLDVNGRTKSWNEIKKRDKKGLKNFSKHNSDLTLDFLKDFELGINTPKAKKGRRTPATLLKLRGICIFLNRFFGKKDFEKITKTELHSLFNKMASGEIKKENGHTYNGTGDFVKNVKTFWGWIMRTKKVSDITEDLARGDYSNGKPAWVYLTHEQIKTLTDNARGDYRALIMFLYDSGMRPQEAYRLYVSDFNEDLTEVTIPEKRENGERVSKTFERTIKLKHSSAHIRAYVKQFDLKTSDLFMKPTQYAFNKYLRTLSKNLFGDGKTKARGTYDKLKLYDLRHLAGIFWKDKYPTNKGVCYRMGWCSEKMLNYYTEFLGERDKIDDEDLLTKEDKNKYEKEIEELKEKFSPENINKEVWKVFSEFLQEQKNLKDYVVTFGSSQKEKPDKKTQKKLMEKREILLSKIQQTS